MRSTGSVPITLGDLQDRVDARVRSGPYKSVSEVLRAAIGALDREEHLLDEALRRKVQAALDDPRPSVPAEHVFSELRADHDELLKAARHDL